MPQRGDKLYAVWNGKLETVTFLEESVAEGAVTPTYVVRAGTSPTTQVRTRVSHDYYLSTAKAAWARYLAEAQQSHAAQVELLAQSQANLEYLADEILKATQMLARCDAP